MARARANVSATRNAAANTAPNDEPSRQADIIDTLDAEQPVKGKKAKVTVSKSKRQQRINDSPTVESEHVVVTKKTRTEKDGKAAEPQAAVRRSGRAHVMTPAAATQKRRRRTKEEMAADKAKAEAEKQQQDKLAERNHRTLAWMDSDEDIDRAETAARTIRTFAELESESGEESTGYADVEDSSDGEAEALTLKEANKMLQKKLKALQAHLDGGKKKGKGGKKTSQNVIFASGLLPDSNSEAEPIKEPVEKRTQLQISSGGLEDSDAEAVNPFPPSSKPAPHTLSQEELTKAAQQAKQDLSRRNDLVSIVESDKEFVPRPAAKKSAVKMKIPVKAAKDEEESMPMKTGKRNKAPLSVKTAVDAKPKAKRLNGNSVRMSDLPEFVREKWRTTFLPTLYDKFFTSDQPFDTFCKGSNEFVTLLQVIVEEVYPDFEYEVTSSDSIHFLAYNRVNEKRSSIGSNAITIVEKHLRTLEGEQAAKDWLRWSRRVDGPLFFKVPSPIDSPVEQNDPEYRFPEGRLLSPFVIGLAAPLLTLRTGSASDNGYPKGLVALIMAALERTVRHLAKPPRSEEKPKDFSKEFWGSKVGIYYNGFHGKNGVSGTHWKEFVDACLGGSDGSEDDTHDADLSILDNNRALVFDFCSPVKSRA